MPLDQCAVAREQDRISAIDRYDILDTAPEPSFDRITRLAARMFNAPMAHIVFVDEERAWFKAKIGIPLDFIPREGSVCDAAIQSLDPLVVPNATKDDRFKDHFLVKPDGGIRYYASAPILTPDGFNIGTVGVMDIVERPAPTEEELQTLKDMAFLVSSELEVRLNLRNRTREADSVSYREQLMLAMAEAPDWLARFETGSGLCRNEVKAHFSLCLRVSKSLRRLVVLEGVDSGVALDEEALAQFDRSLQSQAGLDLAKLMLNDWQVVVGNNIPRSILSDPEIFELSGVEDLLAVLRGLSSPKNGDLFLFTPMSMESGCYVLMLVFSAGQKWLNEKAGLVRDSKATLQRVVNQSLLKERAEVFQRALDACNEAVVIANVASVDNPEPRITYVNKSFTEHTGYTRDELLGRSPKILQGPKTSLQARAAMRNALTNWQPFRQEVLNYRKDGTEYWTEFTVAPVQNERGWYTHWISIQRDTTWRHDGLREIQESEYSFRQLFDFNPKPMWIYDKETFDLLHVNAAVSKTYGWSQTEMQGMKVFDVIPQSDLADLCNRPVPDSVEGRETGPWRHRTRDGIIRVVKTHCRTIVFRGRPAVLVQINDETEGFELESRMHLLDAANANVDDIVLIFQRGTAEGKIPEIVYVNKAFEAFSNIRASELVGHRTETLISKFVVPAPDLELLKAAFFNNSTVRMETLLALHGGEPQWFELENRPVTVGIQDLRVMTLRNINKRKLTEIELRQSEERFRLLCKLSADSVWDWDIRNDIIWMTDSFSERPSERWGNVAETLSDHLVLVHPDDRARAETDLRNMLEGTDSYLETEYRVFDHEKGLHNAWVRMHLFRNDAGQPLRLISTSSDVTRQRDLEQRLQQSQRLEAVGQLTGGIAHDFNNLLTVIMGNAEVLTESLSGTPEADLAAMTLHAAERGSALTNRLLAFARRQTLAPTVANVNELIDSMKGLLERTLGYNIEFKYVGDPALGNVEVDISQLENAILNLCLNARDAMLNGGTVTISTCNVDVSDNPPPSLQTIKPGRYVEIEVRDTGAGMNPDVMARALDPFFTTKEAGKGSGLGLSMVYGFIKQSNGEITLDSKVGVGTTVRIYLPQAHAPVVNSDKSAMSLTSATDLGHILVVEDDQMVRDFVYTQLKNMGYKVNVASDAEQALNIINRFHKYINLIFSDIVMPGKLNGLELAKVSLHRYPELPVLLTSGYSEDNDWRMEIGNSAIGFLPKPYNVKTLQAAVAVALTQHTRPSLEQSQ